MSGHDKKANKYSPSLAHTYFKNRLFAMLELAIEYVINIDIEWNPEKLFSKNVLNGK